MKNKGRTNGCKLENHTAVFSSCTPKACHVPQSSQNGCMFRFNGISSIGLCVPAKAKKLQVALCQIYKMTAANKIHA